MDENVLSVLTLRGLVVGQDCSYAEPREGKPAKVNPVACVAPKGCVFQGYTEVNLSGVVNVAGLIQEQMMLRLENCFGGEKGCEKCGLYSRIVKETST